MKEEQLPSEYGSMEVPPGRATPAEVNDQVRVCLDDPLIQAVLEALSSYAVVLNSQRQILAANPALFKALSVHGSAVYQGLRLGEALGCIHAGEGSDGCGSSRACGSCGALLAMLSTQTTGLPTAAESLLSLKHDGRWEAR